MQNQREHNVAGTHNTPSSCVVFYIQMTLVLRNQTHSKNFFITLNITFRQHQRFQGENDDERRGGVRMVVCESTSHDWAINYRYYVHCFKCIVLPSDCHKQSGSARIYGPVYEACTQIADAARLACILWLDHHQILSYHTITTSIPHYTVEKNISALTCASIFVMHPVIL